MIRSREELKRYALGILALVAVGALSLVNWAQRDRFRVPEDGVVWTDSAAGVLAARVESNSPAALVGVRPGDRLLSIGGHPVDQALEAARLLGEVGAWNRTEYMIEQDGAAQRLSLVVAESGGPGAVGTFLFALGWVYGLIGLLVWLRCRPTPATLRFGAFCLASFATYALSSTGELGAFDRLVHWLDVWALLLLPALFLDFCLHYPGAPARHRGWARLAYGVAVAVGAAHHAAAGGWVGEGIAEPSLVRFFDTAPLALLALNVVAAAYIVRASVLSSKNPVERLQWGWVLHGSLATVMPFTVFYAIPFALGIAPGPNRAFAVFSLGILPASIAVALLRYRLLDLELVWRRCAAAAMATTALALACIGILFPNGSAAPWLARYGPLAWLFSLAVAALLFQPLHKFLRKALDRRYYRSRYDVRRTLADFARELASETDPARMVDAAAGRLAAALDVDRVAIFAADTEREGSSAKFQVLHPRDAAARGEQLDLAWLGSGSGAGPSTVTVAESDPEGLPTAARGCRHYVPCRAQGRTLAWIGLGLTRRGRLLDSDDLALAETLAGPFAIALENGRLHTSLRREAALYQQLKDYNENIVESLSVGILAVDLEGRVQSWNTQLELLLHISREEAVGHQLAELLPPALVDELERRSDENGSGTVYKFRLRAADLPAAHRPGKPRDDDERVVNLAVAPLIAKDFRPIGRLLILDDVTERVELEERVVQADKLSSVGLLAAGVAHEVNTPLAVISSYAQILAERFPGATSEGQLLAKMTEQTFRASEIVNSLLDFSRTAGAEMVPCDLNRVLEDTLDLLAPQLRQAGVSVRKHLLGTPGVLANRNKLQQVFLNLCLNARDAMPHGGNLEITSRRSVAADGADLVEVKVSDTGVGIEPERLGRIFDPFYTTKAPRRGTGLGLAVSYGIVQEHSGLLTVASEPGRGTTFTVTLPLAVQPVHA